MGKSNESLFIFLGLVVNSFSCKLRNYLPHTKETLGITAEDIRVDNEGFYEEDILRNIGIKAKSQTTYLNKWTEVKLSEVILLKDLVEDDDKESITNLNHKIKRIKDKLVNKVGSDFMCPSWQGNSSIKFSSMPKDKNQARRLLNNKIIIPLTKDAELYLRDKDRLKKSMYSNQKRNSNNNFVKYNNDMRLFSFDSLYYMAIGLLVINSK